MSDALCSANSKATAAFNSALETTLNDLAQYKSFQNSPDKDNTQDSKAHRLAKCNGGCCDAVGHAH